MASAPAADATRRRQERRRQLDARRGKCRIRLGGQMAPWCHLKQQLGFALHSQLAKFLLERYSASSCAVSAGPEPLPPKGLQLLVLLSHAHSRECSLVPGLRGPAGRGMGLVWECSAGHTFSWEPAWSCAPAPAEGPPLGLLPSPACSPQEPAGLESEPDGKTPQAEPPRGVGPPPETLSRGVGGREGDGEEEEGAAEDEEEALSDASPWAYSSSPDGQVAAAPTAGSTPAAPPPSASPQGSPAPPQTSEDAAQLGGNSQVTELVARPGSRVCSAAALALDEDTAQIGPKRIRKAAKRELMPCDFPGCGKIFSNRQYLNHHRKYQHIHQKSFRCPEPACGKSFNFKKHLKEHVKLHSDTRDYICEFCARSFRTSSNLVIHRRIHTGEKPLQCEICGFTCRQKASLNWHRRKHAETEAALRFPCEFCGKRFEKLDSVAAHRSKSHPAPRESPGPLPDQGPPGPAQGAASAPQQP
ncbi:zinc finger protein 692 [Ctenodactylus gundi]